MNAELSDDQQAAGEQHDPRKTQTGNVNTHASMMFRNVPPCKPEPLAAIVPATPDESTCVALTGSPKISADAPSA